MDDAINSGDTLTVTSTHTFAGTLFSDFGLAQGDNIVWLENTNITSGDAGQVIVTAIPEPSSLALLGLGGLAMAMLVRRRRS